MRRALLLASLVPVAGALSLAGLATGAAGQEAPTTGGLPPITVRPSGVDEEDEARRREEWLERRLRQTEFLFRSICTHCSPDGRQPPAATANPYGALRTRPPEPVGQ